ncbi:MAG: class I SAM-dependent methyltransferase [Oscillospiraceae bacterium]
MHNNKEMRAFFDAAAAAWPSGECERGVREKILRRAGLQEGMTIADIGCGRGVMIEQLLQYKPRKLIEIDISREMIRLCEKDHPDVCAEYLCDDVLSASLPVLDAAIIFNAYPHLVHKHELAQKLADIVVKGGFVLIAHSTGRDVINSRHSSDDVAALSVDLLSPLDEYRYFENAFSRDDFEDSPELYFLKMTRK